MTPQQALEQMLSGTNVSSELSADGVTLGVRGLTEFVAVAGETPRVPSPKYRAPLRDTPQTVVVIPQQVFQEQNATSLRDVLRNTPGITMSIGEGASGTVARRQRPHPRLQRAQRHLHRRRPRSGRRQPRHVQHRVGGGGEGPIVGHRRPRRHRRLDQSRHQDRRTSQDSANVRVTGGSADYKRATVDVNRRLTGTGRVPLERHVAGRRATRAATSRRTRAGASRRRWRSAWASRRS